MNAKKMIFKQLRHSITSISLLLSIMLLNSCSSSRRLQFTAHEWAVDRNRGCVINADSSLVLALAGNQLMGIPTVIASKAKLDKYDGADKYLNKIFNHFPIKVDSILCYVPELGIIHTQLAPDSTPFKPKSVTSSIGMSDHPYTAWVRDDDTETWSRQGDEMYSNTTLDKRAKQIIILDRYSYGEKEIGTLYVIQTDTKNYNKTGLPESIYGIIDVTNPENIEIAANWVEGHRPISIKSAISGQFPTPLPREFQNKGKYTACIIKADSCYMQKNFLEASAYFTQAFRHATYIQESHLYNAACAASLAGQTNTALNYLYRRAAINREWYLNQPERDPDLKALHGIPRWDDFVRMMNERKASIEKHYDHDLRALLQEIASSDQEVRYQYLNAVNAKPKDSVLIDSLIAEMHEVDSINMNQIDKILTTYGWPSRHAVGDANQAIWLVVQHSDLETIQRWLPLFQEAAEIGDLSPDFVAMMEDRCAVWSGKPQKYGTQGYMENGKFKLNTLLDATKVDEWRKEVGLPPLEEYIQQMDATSNL